jgi:hypothetical protein
MNHAVKKTNARAALVMYGLASVLAVAAIILQIKSFVAPTQAGGSGNLTSLFFVLAVAAVAMGLIADTAGGQNSSVDSTREDEEDYERFMKSSSDAMTDGRFMKSSSDAMTDGSVPYIFHEEMYDEHFVKNSTGATTDEFVDCIFTDPIYSSLSVNIYHEDKFGDRW